MSIFDFKKKVYKNDIFCCFEESYTWSFFILIHVLFVLIQVLISYTGPIFLEYFPEIYGFSRIFPIFSDFFQVFSSFSYAVMRFFRLFLTQGVLRNGKITP
jgi:hypothetical protein